MPRRDRASRAPSRLEGRRRAVMQAAVLGDAVRAARRRRGWSQRQLAAKVDLAQTRVAQIERGAGAGAG
ncbi:MAG: helix-turn-helix domain-containing protein, partial [Chloroflexota bacterium]|nr:helix-turn-helix domain-containing protein [Chloroflexota bacterium]